MCWTNACIDDVMRRNMHVVELFLDDVCLCRGLTRVCVNVCLETRVRYHIYLLLRYSFRMV